MENKVYGYVYLITNKINGKQYVGQTIKTIKKRFSVHKAPNNPSYLNRAIKKYKKENFIIQELAIAYDQKELNFLEGLYMCWFNTLAPNGYNIKEIIDGKGKPSKRTIEKLKKAANKPKNLKIASENGKKCRGKSFGITSSFCGVDLKHNKYVSRICINKNGIHIGTYNIETDAAKAYDIAAIKYFGNDAVLNFPELRQDYINNKIIVNKNKSKSGIKGISFHNRTNSWRIKYFDKNFIKIRTKSFKTLEEAKKFKNDL